MCGAKSYPFMDVMNSAGLVTVGIEPGQLL